MSEVGDLLLDAAERIKELNTENQRLRSTLKAITEHAEAKVASPCRTSRSFQFVMERILETARDALKEATP